MKDKRYHIINNIRELGDFYRQEAETHGDYPGQYGIRKTMNSEGVPLVNLNQDFVRFSTEIKKIRKKYRPIKKSMMRESDAYCNGRVY